MLSRKITKLIARFSQPRNFAILQRSQKEAYLRKLQQNADITYKTYPQLPHQDPNSSEYVPSQFDQYHQKTKVAAYNEVIDNFKNDLQMQRQVWEAINNLDRPYKAGTPGIDTNLYPEGPVKPVLQDLGFQRRDLIGDLKFTFQNEDRFISNTPFHSMLKFKHIQQWEQERKNRPVTKHFNAKGYKYDVQVKPQDKYQYVADRLGHPQFVGTPFEWLFRLQNDLYHPTYLDQPFVKLPSAKPHQSLNFQQGEVLYQNTKVMQWIKFWQMTTLTAGAFGTIFVPYNLAFKTNLVTDAVDENLFSQYHLVTPGIIDITRLSIPIAVGSAFYVVYIVQNFSNFVLSEYVVKMSYSKDQQLLFVKRVDMNGILEQQVYQMAHLQIIPPTQKSAVSFLSSQDTDGLWRITCMNTNKTMLVYNNPKNWNADLRDAFFKKTLGLWDKSYYGYNRDQKANISRKQREDIYNSFTQQALPK